MIPKVIHYCWFGEKPLPDCAKKCIASWQKYCPDYEIKEWNETNVDLASSDYMREAYEAKAWGFVPDVARLQIIYQYGGIYLDTDVEILKSLDPLLTDTAFMGIEDGKFVALGLGFGAEKEHPFIKKLLDDYDGRHFQKADGTLDRTSAPALQSSCFIKNGFKPQNVRQVICNTTIYPMEYFSPMSIRTGMLSLTNNSYSIHHYDASWCTSDEYFCIECRHAIYRKYGCFARFIWFWAHIIIKISQIGLYQTISLVKKRLDMQIKNARLRRLK